MTDDRPDLASDALARAGELPPCYLVDRDAPTVHSGTTIVQFTIYPLLDESRWRMLYDAAMAAGAIHFQINPADRIATLEARVRAAEAESLALLTRLSGALSPKEI